MKKTVRTGKRLTGIFLTLVMLFTMLPVTTFAEDVSAKAMPEALLAGWAGDSTYLKASDMPEDFASRELTLDEANAWSGRPASGSAVLICGIDDGGVFYYQFKDGDTAKTESRHIQLRRNQLNALSVSTAVYYTCQDAAPATPDPETTPTDVPSTPTDIPATPTELVRVHYVTDHGQAPDDDEVEKSSDIALPDAPVSSAYIFRGWSDGAKVFYPGEPYTVEEDTTFTAQWTAAAASVTNGDVTTLYETFAEAERDWGANTTLKLLADAAATAAVSVSNTKTLDLNGHVLQRDLAEAASNGYVIQLNRNGRLTINDTVGTGKITGGKCSGNGGGVYMSSGSALTMNGGAITGNSATNGGGVYVYRGTTFTMNGGAITDNTASTNGGGVYAANGNTGSGGTFVINGGSVTGNSVTDGNGGGVYLGSSISSSRCAKLQVSGTARITGNTKGTGEGAAANNVYLPSSRTQVNVTGVLSGASTIGVTVSPNGSNNPFTNSADTDHNDAARFTSDNSAYLVGKNGNGQLYLGRAVTVTYVTDHGDAPKSDRVISGTAVTLPDAPRASGWVFRGWKTGNNTYDAGAGVTVSGDTTFTAQWAEAVATITKDGVTTEYATFAEAEKAWADGSTLTLIKDVTNTAAIEASGTRTLDLNGHELKRAIETNTGSGYVLHVPNGADLTVKDTSGTGTITGGKGTTYGGGVFVDRGSFTLLGGAITGNEATFGGGIYLDRGTVTLGGGSVTGNVGGVRGPGVYVAGGTLNVSGSPVAGVYLAEGKKITVAGALGDSAAIGVTMASAGTFTDSENAALNDSGKFTSDDAAYIVGVNGDGQLFLGEPVEVKIAYAGHGTDTTRTVASGTVVTLPDAPMESGWVFRGWSDGTATYAEKDEVTVTDDVTFTAQWAEAVASVTDGGKTTEYAAFDEAHTAWIEGGDNAALTLLKDVAVTDRVIVSGTKTLDLNGHTLSRDSKTATANGYVILLSRNIGRLTVKDTVGTGKITGGKGTEYGGGVYMSDKTSLTLTGGTITGNTATNGGGVYMLSGSTLTVTGGAITGNEATFGGGVYVADGSIFRVSGSPAITGNTVSAKSAGDSNVYLAEGAAITVTGALSNTKPIGVSMETVGVFTDSATVANNDAAKFQSDSDTCIVGVNAAGQLLLGQPVTLTYNANGAASGTAPAQETYAKGSQVTVKDQGTLSWTARDFKGWGTKVGGGIIYQADDTFTINAATDLYAQWKAHAAKAPTITRQPADLPLTYGYTSGSVSVSAEADSGADYKLSYQWYSNSIGGNSAGSIIIGATSASYTIPQGLKAGTAKYYFCVVTAKRSDNGETASVTSTAAAVTVAKQDIQPVVTITGWSYGQSPNAPSISSGNPGGGQVAYTYAKEGSEEFSSNVPTGAGKYVVKATVAETPNYNGGEDTAEFTISAVPLTVTAKANAITYGDAPAGNGVTYEGFVNGDAAEDLDGTLDYDFSYQQFGDAGDNYTITPKGLSSDNYAITFAPGKLTVKQKMVGLSWGQTALTYTGKSQRPEVTVTGTVNGDAITAIVDGAQTDTNAKTGKATYTAAVTALKGDKESNYGLPEFCTRDFTISKAALTVTAKDKTIAYGMSPAGGGVTYEGFVGGETEDVLSGKLDYDYTYQRYGDVGDYAVTPKGLSSDNYAITFAPGKLTVIQKVAGIIWGDTDFTYNGKSQIPTAQMDGAVNGDKIQVTVTGAQTDANAKTGTEYYTATATGFTGDKAGNYKLPKDSGQDFTIAPLSITGGKVVLESGSLLRTGLEQAPQIKSVTTKDGMAVDTYDLSGTPAATEVGNYELTVTGTGNFTDSLTAGWRIYAGSVSTTTDKDGETGITVTGEVNTAPDTPTTKADVTAEFGKSLLDNNDPVNEDVNVFLTVEQQKESDVSPANKAAATGAIGGSANTGVGAYVNMDLSKQVGNGAAEQVGESATPLMVTMTVPANMRQAAKSGYSRSFQVLCTVNGAATKMDASYNAATGQLTFPANQFTTATQAVTYVLVYVDKPLPDSGTKFLGEDGTSAASSGTGTASGSSAATAGGSTTVTMTTDLTGINKVTVDGKTVDPKYYTVTGGNVTLSQTYLKTLRSGSHTLQAENATHVSTLTFTVKSANTADSGVALYAALAVMALLGTGYVGLRRRARRG